LSGSASLVTCVSKVVFSFITIFFGLINCKSKFSLFVFACVTTISFEVMGLFLLYYYAQLFHKYLLFQMCNHVYSFHRLNFLLGAFYYYFYCQIPTLQI